MNIKDITKVKIPSMNVLNKAIQRKPVRTISGITPLAVVLPPRKCKHGTCIYCPSWNTPQSYTPKSPAIMRASPLGYDASKQVKARLKSFQLMKHPTEKIELIFIGGSFMQFPYEFKREFVKACFDALNQGKGKNKTLEESQIKNEKAEYRCVAFCIEARPDDITAESIKELREFGVTRVELGVQAIDDEIYKVIDRGHTVQDVVNATELLKNAGFKIGYHLMPGVPGTNYKKDIEMFKEIFSDERFKPDQLKIYPCVVIKNSKLEEIYWKEKYKPYETEEIKKFLFEIYPLIPRYCRIMRVMREIPPEHTVAGTIKIDLRNEIELALKKNEKLRKKIKEIRFREIGFNTKNTPKENKLELKITKYKASGGEEYFLEIINKEDVLFGLLRLRIIDASNQSSTRPSTRNNINVESPLSDVTADYQLTKSSKLSINNKDNKLNLSKLISNKKAIIRELHVYGQALNLGEKGTLGQHTGLGKWLMAEAEKIARDEKCSEISIISGVGVREYYRRLGYILENTYMKKSLND